MKELDQETDRGDGKTVEGLLLVVTIETLVNGRPRAGEHVFAVDVDEAECERLMLLSTVSWLRSSGWRR